MELELYSFEISNKQFYFKKLSSKKDHYGFDKTEQIVIDNHFKDLVKVHSFDPITRLLVLSTGKGDLFGHYHASKIKSTSFEYKLFLDNL